MKSTKLPSNDIALYNWVIFRLLGCLKGPYFSFLTIPLCRPAGMKDEITIFSHSEIKLIEFFVVVDFNFKCSRCFDDIST